MTVVVAFVSRKGGVGKSTLARALAAVAARRGLSLVLADLDRDQRTAIRWQRLREKSGVFPPLTVEAYGNVDSAIACTPDIDLLIVDAPGNAPAMTMEIASVAHFIVQPSGACFDDLQPAVELFYELKASGIPKSRMLIALSRMLNSDEEEAARAYIEVADFNVLPGAIIERARYREAHNQGLAFIETPGEDLSAPAGVALAALLTKIIRKHRTLRPRPALGASA
jgi:chromosome partitioning protein